MKKLLISNGICLLIAGLLFPILFISSESTTFATQQENVDTLEIAKGLRIAVVNISTILKETDEIKSFKKKLIELEPERQRTKKELEYILEDIQKALFNLRRRGLQNFNLEREYLKCCAKYATLNDVYDFKKKILIHTFSKKFPKKISEKIRTYSASRYDIVFYISDAKDKESKLISDLLNLNIPRNEYIPYFDKRTVTDITKSIVRLINIDK